MMKMPQRFLHQAFHLDANGINSRGRLEDVNQLEKWHANGVILLGMSEVAQQEAGHGDQLRKEKADSYIFSMTEASTAQEKVSLTDIETILFPGGAKDQNQLNDVEIVFNAMKYGRILVTDDGGSGGQPGGILGNRGKLGRLSVTVMTAPEAVMFVRERIDVRDRNARYIANKTGEALPSWVGGD